MSLHFHEIAETNHRIQNPFTEDKLMLLGEMCGLTRSTRLLDLACGKGELLCRWSQAYGIKGTGVDISEVFIHAAQERANELSVWSDVNFVVSDAAEYPQEFHQYNIVTCIGATWIGGGLLGTLDLMRISLKDKNDGLLVVGETFWNREPSDGACQALGLQREYLTDLGGMAERFDQAQVELIQMMIATRTEWDQYYTLQWMTVAQWLHNNPKDPEAPALREWIDNNRRVYLKYEREYVGWGVFVLRPR